MIFRAFTDDERTGRSPGSKRARKRRDDSVVVVVVHSAAAVFRDLEKDDTRGDDDSRVVFESECVLRGRD